MNIPWTTPALRGLIGDWIYYSAVISAEQISKHIVPFHKIRESKSLEDYLQRTLKTRVNGIAKYLQTHESRFFNSVIVGIFGALPDWHELNLEKVVQNLDDTTSYNLQQTLGMLSFSGAESMFAIDGQHRVEGIKRAFEADPTRFSEDQYTVLFVAHRDDEAGKVRTRRLFCDINKNAVSVSPGDKVIIDEDDLCAVTTRRFYVEYPAFKLGQEIAVTERKEDLVEKGTDRFTSLLALYTVAQKLRKLVRVQPNKLEAAQENVVSLTKVMENFFDFIIQYEPTLQAYFQQGGIDLTEQRLKNKNLFFRPVGLEVLARVYVDAHRVSKLKNFADGLKNLNFANPGGVFDQVLWTSGKIKAGAKERNAACDLLLYIIGLLDSRSKSTLLDRLQEITHNLKYKLPPKLGL